MQTGETARSLVLLHLMSTNAGEPIRQANVSDYQTISNRSSFCPRPKEQESGAGRFRAVARKTSPWVAVR